MVRFEKDPHLRAEFFKLQLQFLANANNDVTEIVELIDGSASCDPSSEAGKRLRRLSHGLRGAGGSYGFDDVTSTAAQLEEACLATASLAELRKAALALKDALGVAHQQLDAERDGV